MALQEALFHQLHGLSPHLRLMYISNNMKEKLFKLTVLSYTHSWIINLLCALYIQMVLCVIVYAHSKVYVPDISTSCKKSCRKLMIFRSVLPLDVPFSLKLGWQFMIMKSASGYKETVNAYLVKYFKCSNIGL